MKIKVCAYGDNIKTAEYSFWIDGYTIGTSSSPETKTTFKKDIILNSILKSGAVRFFSSEPEAICSARTLAKKEHVGNKYLECPVIFEVIMTLTPQRQFQGANLVWAKILNSTGVQTELNLKHELNSNEVLTCTPDNYQGNYDQLFKPAANFTFLCGNSRGFTPEGQTNTYQLPSEVTTLIGEYVVGRAFK